MEENQTTTQNHVKLIVERIRRMADDIERRLGNEKNMYSLCQYTTHTVAWGVANLLLDHLHTTLERDIRWAEAERNRP